MCLIEGGLAKVVNDSGSHQHTPAQGASSRTTGQSNSKMQAEKRGGGIGANSGFGSGSRMKRLGEHTGGGWDDGSKNSVFSKDDGECETRIPELLVPLSLGFEAS